MLKNTQRASGVTLLTFISVGVVCLHALALWLISMDTPQAPAASPPFVVLVAPPQLLPSPVTAPTAAKSAKPTAQVAPAPRIKKPAKHLEIPAIKPAPARPSADAPPPAAAATGSSPTMAVAPANLPMQLPDHNATSPGAGTGAGNDKTAPSIQLPSSNADYLNNPAPTYPVLSRRLGEQGKVVVRVLIGKDGMALRGDIHQSSGFERLDQAALRAVLSWRYVPGQRAGIAQDMWFNVPVNFSLN